MDKRGLEKVYNAGLKLLIPLDISDVYKVICEQATKIVGGQYATIFLEFEGELKRVYSTIPTLNQIEIRKNGFTYQVFKSQIPKVLNVETIAKIHPEIKQVSARSDILVPLINQKKSIGVFTVLSSKKQQFTEEDMKVLTLFGPMASLAIRKAQFYEEAKRALETRDLFISMAAHELRTPLTTINGYVQLLNSRLDKNQGSVESRWIYELSRESTRMTNLVNELLEANRIKSGKFRYSFQECHLSDVIERAMRNFQLIYPDRMIHFNNTLSNGKDLIIGDFEKLIQLISNLVDNAIKFSSNDSPLTITLRSKPGWVIIDVVDQGKGIHNKEISKIFDSFYRSNENNEEGMGIGLYLVKNIIQIHRGDVKVSSKLNKGTTFTISLPSYSHGK